MESQYSFHLHFSGQGYWMLFLYFLVICIFKSCPSISLGCLLPDLSHWGRCLCMFFISQRPCNWGGACVFFISQRLCNWEGCLGLLYITEILADQCFIHSFIHEALFTVAKLWNQLRCPSTEERLWKIPFINTMEFFPHIEKSDIMKSRHDIHTKWTKSQKIKKKITSSFLLILGRRLWTNETIYVQSTLEQKQKCLVGKRRPVGAGPRKRRAEGLGGTCLKHLIFLQGNCLGKQCFVLFCFLYPGCGLTSLLKVHYVL